MHGLRSASGALVRFLKVNRPALAYQERLETLDRIMRAGKIRVLTDLRSPIYVSMASVEREPSVTVKPPYWLLRGLAFVGRRLGYTLT